MCRFEQNLNTVVIFWVLSWASFCLMFINFTGANGEVAASALFLSGCPIFASMASWYVNYRRMILISCPLSELNSPIEIELRIRFLLEPITQVRRNGDSLSHQNTTDKSNDEPVTGKPQENGADDLNSSVNTHGGITNSESRHNAASKDLRYKSKTHDDDASAESKLKAAEGKLLGTCFVLILFMSSWLLIIK